MHGDLINYLYPNLATPLHRNCNKIVNCKSCRSTCELTSSLALLPLCFCPDDCVNACPLFGSFCRPGRVTITILVCCRSSKQLRSNVINALACFYCGQKQSGHQQREKELQWSVANCGGSHQKVSFLNTYLHLSVPFAQHTWWWVCRSSGSYARDGVENHWRHTSFFVLGLFSTG